MQLTEPRSVDADSESIHSKISPPQIVFQSPNADLGLARIGRVPLLARPHELYLSRFKRQHSRSKSLMNDNMIASKLAPNCLGKADTITNHKDINILVAESEKEIAHIPSNNVGLKTVLVCYLSDPGQQGA